MSELTRSLIPTLVVVTERNDVFLLEGHLDKKEYRKAEGDDEENATNVMEVRTSKRESRKR